MTTNCDTDRIIWNLIDTNDKFLLSQVNKSYHKLLSETSLYQQIHKLYRSRNIITNTVITRFKAACRQNFMEYAKYLYKCHKPNIMSAIITCCKYGHLKLAKWVYKSCLDVTTDKVAIKRIFKRSFYYACRNGHVNIGSWIIKLNVINIKSSVRIGMIRHIYFSVCCDYGQLEMAKWFYSSWETRYYGYGSVDIHRKTDEALRCAIRSYVVGRGDANLLPWLLSLPTATDYQFDIFDYEALSIVPYLTAKCVKVGVRLVGRKLQRLSHLIV